MVEMNTFSGCISLWRLLGDSEPLHVLFNILGAPRVRRGSKNWYKLTDFMAFGHFL